VQVDVGVEHRHGGGLEEEDELDPNLKTVNRGPMLHRISGKLGRKSLKAFLTARKLGKYFFKE
jgi:hypothetical protein